MGAVNHTVWYILHVGDINVTKAQFSVEPGIVAIVDKSADIRISLPVHMHLVEAVTGRDELVPVQRNCGIPHRLTFIINGTSCEKLRELYIRLGDMPDNHAIGVVVCRIARRFGVR